MIVKYIVYSILILNVICCTAIGIIASSIQKLDKMEVEKKLTSNK